MEFKLLGYLLDVRGKGEGGVGLMFIFLVCVFGIRWYYLLKWGI